MANGLGLLPREIDTGSAAARIKGTVTPQAAPQSGPAPTQLAAAPQPSPPLPKAQPAQAFGQKFQQDPLAAIGLLLSNVGAGIRGQELPTTRQDREQRIAAGQERQMNMQQQGLRLQAAGVAFKAIENGVEMIKNVPVEQHGEVIERIASSIELPGVDLKGILTAHSQGQLKNFEANIKALNADPIMAAMVASLPLETMAPAEQAKAIDSIVQTKQSIVAKVAEQRALAPGKEAAAERTAELGVETAVAEQEALAPGRLQEVTQQAAINIQAALAEQGVLAPGRLEEAQNIAKVEIEKQLQIATGKGEAFKSERVQVRDAESGEISTFVADTTAAKADLDQQLKDKKLVKTSVVAPPRFESHVDPVSGERFKVDTQTGDVTPLRPPEVTAEEAPSVVRGVETPQQPKNVFFRTLGGDTVQTPLPESLERPNITENPAFQVPVIFSLGNLGVPGKFKSALSKTIGQLSPELSFPDVAEERERIGLLKAQIRQAYREEGGRTPVVVLEQLLRLVPDEQAFFENPTDAAAQLGELSQNLKVNIQNDSAFAKDRRNPADARKDAIERVRGSLVVLDMIGPVAATEADVDRLAPGTLFYWKPGRVYAEKE